MFAHRKNAKPVLAEMRNFHIIVLHSHNDTNTIRYRKFSNQRMLSNRW